MQKYLELGQESNWEKNENLKINSVQIDYVIKSYKSQEQLPSHCSIQGNHHVTHFLIECPGFMNQRNKLKRKLFTHGIVRIKSEILLGASNEDDHLKGNITNWEIFW